MEELRKLTGWAGTAPSVARVRRVGSVDEVAAAVGDAPARGVIARGLGRSYGDLAQNGGGLVLDMTGLRRIRDFDRERGEITLDAGCSLADLLRATVAEGWFVPVTPGTRHVTVGGAIACDVHGKNHHRDGSFGSHVVSLSLLTPAGDVLVLDPERSPDEFWATAGGLGLTGVILEATVRLHRIETSTLRVDVERAVDLDDALARLTATDHLYCYSVAWIDCLATGRGFGRSVLMRGNHAAAADLGARGRNGRLEAAGDSRLRIPTRLSVAPLLRSPAAAAFNELYFRRARDSRDRLQELDAFFYPLDAVRDWNRLYGRGGFLQYQFVVPFGCEDVLAAVLRMIGSVRPGPVLGVLKRFGPASGPLSFPIQGWTLALDVPLPAPGLGPVLDAADDLVAAAGGRVYLAKDSRLHRSRLAAMYPRLSDWREVQARLDPSGRMQCDLARRLDVTERRVA